MINIIVAYCKNRGMGINNKLPWMISKDLKRFKIFTMGNGNNGVIMGRKTWESLPFRPLPRRKNIVLSRTMEVTTSNCIVKRNLEDALDYTNKNKLNSTWIIGGGEIYDEALKSNYVNNVYVTEIKEDFECDVFFSELPDHYDLRYQSNWNLSKSIQCDCTFRYLHYKNISSKKFIPFSCSD